LKTGKGSKMTPERFSYLATKHAPFRCAVGVESNKDENIIKLECGHVLTYSPHFSVKVGNTHRCDECGVEKIRRDNIQ
jgi:hypothetical protein